MKDYVEVSEKIVTKLQAENESMYREIQALHLCLKRCWEALGINKYTGKSLSEYIAELKEKITGLESKCRDYNSQYMHHERIIDEMQKEIDDLTQAEGTIN